LPKAMGVQGISKSEGSANSPVMKARQTPLWD